MRVETRLPGGDVNPYLAFAALIAAGLARNRARARAAPAARGQRLRVRRRALPRIAPRGDRRTRGRDDGAGGVGRRGRRPLPELRTHRAAALRPGRHLLGARTALRARLDEVARAGGRDRRRGRRLLDPLLADQARLDRRRPRRAGRADERLDLPLGRPRRPAAQLAQPDEDDDELGRALPDARRGGRARDRLARGRLAPPGLERRSGWRSSPASRAGRRRSACRSS